MTNQARIQEFSSGGGGQLSEIFDKQTKLEPQGALIAHLSTMSTSVIS